MPKIVRIAGQEFDACLDNGEFPESVASVIEEILEDMKANPGGGVQEITLVISNDFEPEEDEESDDESTDETETKE